MHCDFAKEIRDKLQNFYEGNAKVKVAKIQSYRGQFEQLKMKEDEDIAAYFLRVDETVNAIKGMGEEVENIMIVQKILRYLLMRFDPKISTLEEREYLGMLSMDELHGIFTTYKMRTKQEDSFKKEAAFKESKYTKKKKISNSKLSCSCSDDSNENEEIANFVKKLKRRTDKYKGIIPLKCFNFGKIGHFVNKCSYAKKSDSGEQEDPKKEKKYQKGNKKGDKRKAFKKNMCSREDGSSSDEDDEDDSDSERLLFMATKTNLEKNS
jgi:hypothetical protein